MFSHEIITKYFFYPYQVFGNVTFTKNWLYIISNSINSWEDLGTSPIYTGTLVKKLCAAELFKSADLDGGPGEAAQLFDVLPLLSNYGSDCLCWDVNMDRLDLWGLDTRIQMIYYIYS